MWINGRGTATRNGRSPEHGRWRRHTPPAVHASSWSSERAPAALGLVGWGLVTFVRRVALENGELGSESALYIYIYIFMEGEERERESGWREKRKRADGGGGGRGGRCGDGAAVGDAQGAAGGREGGPAGGERAGGGRQQDEARGRHSTGLRRRSPHLRRELRPGDPRESSPGVPWVFAPPLFARFLLGLIAKLWMFLAAGGNLGKGTGTDSNQYRLLPCVRGVSLSPAVWLPDEVWIVMRKWIFQLEKWSKLSSSCQTEEKRWSEFSQFTWEETRIWFGKLSGRVTVLHLLRLLVKTMKSLGLVERWKDKKEGKGP